MGPSVLLLMALLFEALMLALGWLLWGLAWKFLLLWGIGAVCITLLVLVDVVNENPYGRLATALRRGLARLPGVED